MQPRPPLAPVSRADGGVDVFLKLREHFCQGRVNGDMAGAACFAVLWGDADDPGFLSHIAPAQSLYLMRAYAGVEHDSHRRQAAPAIVLRRCIQQTGDFFLCEDADAFFCHALRLHVPYRVSRTPPALEGGGEYAAEDEPCFVALPWRVKGFSYVVRAFCCGDASHTPFCQPFAAFHQSAADVAEIQQCPFPSLCPRCQGFFYRSLKGDGFFPSPQRFFSCFDARERALDPASPRFQRRFCYQSRLKDVYPGASQYFEGGYFFVLMCYGDHVRENLQSVMQA